MSVWTLLRDQQVDFSAPIDQLILTPGVHPGLSVLAPPDWLWRSRPRGRILARPISAHAPFNDQAAVHIRHFERLRRFQGAIEFNTLPVVLEQVGFEKSFVSARGRFILNGATGTRLRNRLAWYGDPPAERDGAVMDHLADMAAQNHGPLPVWSGPTKNIPFAIECRNTFNFYHFLIETLGTLCLAPPEGKVLIHSPSNEVRPFAKAWVEALFPELRGRVRFLQAPRSYGHVLSAYSARHLYHQCSDALMPSLKALGPGGWLWKDRRADRNSQGVLAMNGYDSALRLLRERALRMAAQQDMSHLPRRVWISRSSSGPRVRSMKNEMKLYRTLSGLGFKRVLFEDLTPLEQVGLMANAEVVASYHGAGFANMAFANPDCEVIEIGHLQTALHRWADFMPMAHLARCGYTSFFADHNVPDPTVLPDITEALAPVAISEAWIEEVAAHVEATLADLPGRVLRRATRLIEDGDPAAALRLLDEQAPVLEGQVEALVLRANACSAAQDIEGTFEHLMRAWDMGPDRPALLERLIPLARRAGRSHLLPQLVEAHANRFPERHAALRTRLPWLQS